MQTPLRPLLYTLKIKKSLYHLKGQFHFGYSPFIEIQRHDLMHLGNQLASVKLQHFNLWKPYPCREPM